MSAQILLTTDWHLTDNPEHEYRWQVFEWVLSAVVGSVKTSTPILAVVVAGDITDKKSDHKARFVKRVADSFMTLATLLRDRCKCELVWVVGNHDHLNDPQYPFFGFLRHLGVEVVTRPRTQLLSGFLTYLIPHSYEPMQQREDINFQYLKDSDVIIMHETFNGAKASNGSKLPGSSFKMFRNLNAVCFSGDIHVPQQLGPITYIGTPYGVHFGDVYEGRFLLVTKDRGEVTWNTFTLPTTVKRASLKLPLTRYIETFEDLVDRWDLTEGDHVSVELSGSSKDPEDWRIARSLILKACDDHGFLVHGGVKERSIVRVPLLEAAEDDEDLLGAAEALGSSYRSAEQALRVFADKAQLTELCTEVGAEILKASKK